MEKRLKSELWGPMLFRIPVEKDESAGGGVRRVIQKCKRKTRKYKILEGRKGGCFGMEQLTTFRV